MAYHSFLSFLFLFWNWSVIALQCCVSFCYIRKRISYMYTCIPSPWGHRPTPSHCLGHHGPPSWFPLAILYILGGASGNESMYQCRGHKERRLWSLGQEDPQRRAWRPTPVFLPGESHEQRSLVGHSPMSYSQVQLWWHHARGCVCGFPWWFRWWRICLQCRRQL